MKILFLIFLTLSFSISTYSQSQKVRDEIEGVIAKAKEIESVDSKEALQYYMETEKKYRQRKYSDTDVQVFYNQMALFYEDHGLYEEGLKVILDLEQNSTTVYYRYMNTASNIYSDIKNFTKAIEYDQKFIARAIEQNDTVSIIAAYENLSDVYIQLENPNEAIAQLAKATDFNDKFSTTDSSIYFHNLGVAYTHKQLYDQAKINLQRGLQIDLRYSQNRNYDLPYDYLEQGNLEEAKNNLRDALRYYDSALLHVNRSTPMELQLKLYRQIFSVCDRLNQYKKGFENSLKYTALRDSIFSVERVQNLGVMELQNLFSQKQKEDQAELNRKRLIQYSGVFFFLLITLVITFYIARFNVNPKILGSIIFITILLFFEFILVVLEPVLNKFTGNTPIYILLGNFVVALLFIPIHRIAENWFDKKVLHTGIDKKSSR